MSPIVEAVDLTKGIGDAEGYPISIDERAFRDLLFGYCNEYVAFDLGFQFCRFYEVAKKDGSKRASRLVLPEDYLRTLIGPPEWSKWDVSLALASTREVTSHTVGTRATTGDV